jgi:hypothetical protein
MLRQLCRSDDARVEIDGASLVNDVSTASVLLTRGRRVSASRMPGKVFLPHRQQSMLLRFNPCTNSITLGLRYTAFFPCRRRHNLTSPSSTRDNCLLAAMAPKQATLGYVKSSQTTLGCGDTFRYHGIMVAILTISLQEIFRKPEWRSPKTAIEAILFDETKE